MILAEISVEWMLIRGAGFAAFALLAASTIWGLLITTKMLGPLVKAKPVTWFHESLAVAAVIATFVHMFALSIHEYIPFTWADLLVPGLSSWHPVSTAFGVMAFYGMFLISISFYVKKWIGQNMWRTIHFGSFGAFVSAALHGIMSGTDSGSLGAVILYSASLVSVILLVILRFAQHAAAQGKGGRSRRPSGAPSERIPAEARAERIPAEVRAARSERIPEEVRAARSERIPAEVRERSERIPAEARAARSERIPAEVRDRSERIPAEVRAAAADTPAAARSPEPGPLARRLAELKAAEEKRQVPLRLPESPVAPIGTAPATPAAATPTPPVIEPQVPARPPAEGRPPQVRPAPAASIQSVSPTMPASPSEVPTPPPAATRPPAAPPSATAGDAVPATERPRFARIPTSVDNGATTPVGGNGYAIGGSVAPDAEGVLSGKLSQRVAEVAARSRSVAAAPAELEITLDRSGRPSEEPASSPANGSGGDVAEMIARLTEQVARLERQLRDQGRNG